MILKNRVRLLESQVIKKEDLYLRWEHATKEEIAEICKEGKLRSYQYHKGPINGFLFCLPSDAWHDGRYYHDEDVSYFLLEDVENCEKEYPDFIGDTLNSSLACGTNEDIPAEQIRKELGMSRNDFKDFLNDDSGDRLMTSREEEFRDYRDTYGFHGGLVPFFSMGMLEGLTVERIDWENWQTRQRKALPKNTTQEFTVVFSPDETQQKWIDAVQDGKKKEARIAELEQEITANSVGGTAACDGKGLPSVVCRMRRKGKTDEEIAAHLHAGGSWCSHAQVGALLHTDDTSVAARSMSQRARRLLGKA